MRRRPVELPSLVHDFSHAHICGVVFGPRREFTLAVSLLVWHQQTGRLTDPAPVRFGGVENLDEVRACFAAAPHERSELAWLAYAADPASRPGRLVFDLVFERIDLRLLVRCSSLQVGAPGEAPDAEPGAAADTGRL